MTERNQAVVYYLSYRLIQKLDRDHDELDFMMQKIRKKVAVRMKEQAFSGQHSISAINFLTELKQAYDPSQNAEGVTGWLFREFFPVPPFLLSRSGSYYYQTTLAHVKVPICDIP